MSKPEITQEQVQAIEKLLRRDMYKYDKDALVNKHAIPSGTWGFGGLDDLELTTLCRYLYAPDTVEIEMTVDEQLLDHFDNATTYNNNIIYEGPEAKAFKRGMRTALRIIGRKTPGIITWEDDN